MNWYTLEKQTSEELQQVYAVKELYDGLTVLESSRYVFTEAEKIGYNIDFDAVSYYAAKYNDTNEVKALIMLEKVDATAVSYKPYTENDCPGAAAYCPRSILSKLTPTRNFNAKKWRDNAYKSLEIIEATVNKKTAEGSRIQKEKGHSRGMKM